MMEQLNLGQLICKLKKCKSDAKVRFDFGGFVPDGLDSYRGYYNQLALGFCEDKEVTVAELLLEARATLGKSFSGYKGGDYVMDHGTSLWVSNYGQAHDTAIVGVTDCGWHVVINTAYFN